MHRASVVPTSALCETSKLIIDSGIERRSTVPVKQFFWRYKNSTFDGREKAQVELANRMVFVQEDVFYVPRKMA